jgi:hypothetical protein
MMEIISHATGIYSDVIVYNEQNYVRCRFPGGSNQKCFGLISLLVQDAIQRAKYGEETAYNIYYTTNTQLHYVS